MWFQGSGSRVIGYTSIDIEYNAWSGIITEFNKLLLFIKLIIGKLSDDMVVGAAAASSYLRLTIMQV